MAEAQAGLSDYELERARNIARNEAYLASLGLASAPAAAKKAKRRSVPHQPKMRGVSPSRQSARQRGEAALTAAGAAAAAAADFVADLAEGGKLVAPLRIARPSNAPRLTDAQAAFLDGIHGENNGLLTEAERAAAIEAAEACTAWSTEAWVRDELRGRPVRRPAWLDAMEASAVLRGKSTSNRAKVMFVLEKMCAGVGAASASWPRGLALCNVREPRVLTLGTDLEKLKFVGKTRDAQHGTDVSNGWAWAHALGKLRLYQQVVLDELGLSTAFEGPSLAQLDQSALDALVDQANPTKAANRLPLETNGPVADDAAPREHARKGGGPATATPVDAPSRRQQQQQRQRRQQQQQQPEDDEEATNENLSDSPAALDASSSSSAEQAAAEVAASTEDAARPAPENAEEAAPTPLVEAATKTGLADHRDADAGPAAAVSPDAPSTKASPKRAREAAPTTKSKQTTIDATKENVKNKDPPPPASKKQLTIAAMWSAKMMTTAK